MNQPYLFFLTMKHADYFPTQNFVLSSDLTWDTFLLSPHLCCNSSTLSHGRISIMTHDMSGVYILSKISMVPNFNLQ